ncbi:MAG TPA: AAA family ATPase [Gemmatimonadales bacterium]
MPGYVLTLFGHPRLSAEGLPEPRLSSKAIGLLAYLVLEPGPHSRESLAGLLWGESDDESARTSLRQAVMHLRDAIGDAIRADRTSVGLAGVLECDAVRFLAMVHAEPRKAAEFDVPRFFADVTVRGAPAFEEWLDRTRHQLVRRYQEALRVAAREAVARSRWREAMDLADRWLLADPLAEEAMGVLMESLYCQGSRGSALARYRDFKDLLRREIGSVPGEGLAELARQLEIAAGMADADDEPPAPLRFESDLVGREEPWGELTHALTAAATEGPQVILLEGEAGIGKTRLAEEFIRWAGAHGATVLRGQGYQSTDEAPFGSITAALRGGLGAPGLACTDPEWLAEVSRLVPELNRRFPGLQPAPTAPGGLERLRLFEGVAQLFLALAAERPTVLFLDDLQWCDGESCALVNFLLRRLDGSPIIFLATITAGELVRDLPARQLVADLSSQAHCRAIAVAPLTEDEVWRLVRQMGNIRTPTGGRRFARRLYEVSDGNPFQVIEITKMLFAEGLLAVTPVSREWVIPAEADATSFGRVEIPRSVRDALSARVSRLPYELRDLLASIATAGRPVRTEVLSRLHGFSRLRVAALADALVERHLVDEDDGCYRPAHPIIGDYLRSALTTARRAELHRALSLALEETTRPERIKEVAGEIAWHAERGQDDERAFRFALVASENAKERLGFEEALAWLNMARRAMPNEGAAVDERVAALAVQAGWSEIPVLAADADGTSLSDSDIDLRIAGDGQGRLAAIE